MKTRTSPAGVSRRSARARRCRWSAAARRCRVGCATGPTTTAERKLGRVLVVGGGFGGDDCREVPEEGGGPGLEVMLVERQTAFVSCPLSNLVLGGSRKIADLTVLYDGLRRRRHRRQREVRRSIRPNARDLPQAANQS